MLHIFTDGSARGGGGLRKPTGVGVVVLSTETYDLLSSDLFSREYRLREVTRASLLTISTPTGFGANTTAELYAVYAAALGVKRLQKAGIVSGRGATLHTDSQYTIDALTRFRHAKRDTDTVHDITELIERFFGTWYYEKVKGHSGHLLNDLAHKLAYQASRKRAEPEYSGQHGSWLTRFYKERETQLWLPKKTQNSPHLSTSSC